MALRDHIRIGRRFQRAIRIDADLGDPQALQGFILPASSAEILLTMAHHVAETKQAAFTWTGPYGSGKSSLVVALSALLSGEQKKRDQAARIIDPKAAKQLCKLLPPNSKGWRVLPVVGRRENPTEVIGEALVVSGLAKKPRGKGWTQSAVLAELSSISAETPRSRGGLIVFIDEMGKFLEGAASENSDIYIFQQLAELAARSNGRLIVVGVLHQAFEEYAYRLGREQRDEWAKIQGRFIDLIVNTSGEEQLEILARAIEPDGHAKRTMPSVPIVAKCIAANRRNSEKSLSAILSRCWPLHPVVAALLGPISRRRFGQNQRSLFGFLNSAEPNGFQDFLRDAIDGEIYAPDRLWDYLRVNLEPSILASPDGHRWSMAVEAIERCESRDDAQLHVQLLKGLALIDLFKERSGLIATADILGSCAGDYSAKKIEKALDELTSWSLIIFKRHIGSYAIYAGSDFDIDVALRDALEGIKGVDFRALRSAAAFHPIIAKRHYHETGALRWFDVDLIPANALADAMADYKPSNGAMGVFFLPIPTEAGEAVRLKEFCRETTEGIPRKNIIVGYSAHTNRVVELAREVLALTQIQQERPELAGDNVARRELLARLSDAQDQLELLLGQILDNATWYRHGSPEKTYSSAGLSSLASNIADKVFRSAPKISNELLNRIKPSSSARSGLNALLRRMVLNEGEVRLGIDGFPAEGGLFASVLEATGLYKRTKNGWRYVAPGVYGEDPANLLSLWNSADAFLQSKTGRTVNLDELFALWRKPPFGIKEGLLSILGVAYVLSQRDHIAVYREGVFRARIDDLDIDYLAKDPRDIQLRWLDINKATQRLLADLGGIAQEFGAGTCNLAPTPIDTARSLVSAYEKLEPWTKRTMRLSPDALRIRNVFKHASDPNRLLFDDLPGLVGTETDLGAKEGAADAIAVVRTSMQELRGRYRHMLDSVRKLLLKELQVLDASPSSFALLRQRAQNVVGVAELGLLNTFVVRLSHFEGADADLEGLVSFSTNKPPRDWTDPDIDKATLELSQFSQQFIRLEAFARVKGRRDKRHAISVVVGVGGQPTPIWHEFSVTDEDSSAVEDLINRVVNILEQADQQQKNIVLAALAELSARYMRDSDEAANDRLKAVGR